MREMKLSIQDISRKGECVKAFAEIVFKSVVLGMDMDTPCCCFEVDTPYQEGKTLEQYEAELTTKAKDRITAMYKEVVCDGQNAESSLNMLVGKIEPTEITQKMSIAISGPGTDLEERIASIEKKLSSELGASELAAIYEVGRKAAADFLCEQKKRPADEAPAYIGPDCRIKGTLCSNRIHGDVVLPHS